MKLRNKLAIYYSICFMLVLSLTLLVIYLVSEKNRKEEFYKRIKDKTQTTLHLFLDVKQINHDLLRIVDKNTINSLENDKIFLFDNTGKLIYSNTDENKINYNTNILERLKRGESEIQFSQNNNEILGIKVFDNNRTYFAIAEAYDNFGKNKIHFLGLLLILSFFIALIILIAFSFYLSGFITQPISTLTKELENISLENSSVRVPLPQSKDEVYYLSTRFNETLDRVEQAFRFQKHFINHVSHELKTPLAVMMMNAERSLKEQDAESVKSNWDFQKNSIMDLSQIIDTLMDISKSESQQDFLYNQNIRVDELLFETIEGLRLLNESLQVDFKISESINDEKDLTVSGNERMLKLAILNLLKNAINYSESGKPSVFISKKDHSFIQIQIINNGSLIGDDEKQMLFRHYFRGTNSRNTKGFGLGLVLTKRIIHLLKGDLHYSVTDEGLNCFSITLPKFQR